MICPHCGVEIENESSFCPLCGKEINKEKEYEKLVLKGDGAMEDERGGAAVGFYEKALQITGGSEEIYIKLGNAYNKKGDKRAAGIYFKALKCNFYNEHVHNLLISIYDKYNRLGDLKAWYEKSGNRIAPEFAEKFIKIIDNIKYFKKEAGGGPKAEEKPSGGFISYIKKYGMMNAALVVFAAIMAGAVIAGVVFKTDPYVMLLFGMVFFIASIFIISYINIKKVKKKKQDKKNKESFDDLLPPKEK